MPLSPPPASRRQALPVLRGLYAITPDWQSLPQPLAAIEAVLAGGCRLIQYRDKKASTEERYQRASALLSLCQRYAAYLIINDDLELAVACQADGVHLGSSDADLTQARQQLGAHKILGASCYNSLPQARQAARAGADYLALGAVFPSLSKPDAQRADLSLFVEYRCDPLLQAIPNCAIGGISAENAQSVVEAGASMLAVISNLFAPASASGPYPVSCAAISERAAHFVGLFD